MVGGALLGGEGVGSAGDSAPGNQIVISFLLLPTFSPSPSLSLLSTLLNSASTGPTKGTHQQSKLLDLPCSVCILWCPISRHRDSHRVLRGLFVRWGRSRLEPVVEIYVDGGANVPVLLLPPLMALPELLLLLRALPYLPTLLSLAKPLLPFLLLLSLLL